MGPKWAQKQLDVSIPRGYPGPKTSKVSPQTPKVFERGPEYPQIDSKWLQKGSKWPQKASKGSKITPNGFKRAQNAANYAKAPPPQKALHPPYTPTQCLFQAFPRHKYPSGTLRGPSKATQYPSGPLLHAAGGPKGPGRAKKRPWAFFCPSNATIVLNSRPKWVKIGQTGSKCCSNC